MILRGRDKSSTGKMPCESCAVQFSVFRRKRSCCECERYYCSGCLRRGGGAMCAPCRVLSTRPLSRQTIVHLKVRDLQCFLQRQNVSTRGCVEKEELVNLCISHVNSSAYRRGGQRDSSNPFISLRGLTNNINDFINSTFDLRTATPQQGPPPTTRNCFNSSHSHASSDRAPAERRAPPAAPPTAPTAPPTAPTAPPTSPTAPPTAPTAAPTAAPQRRRHERFTTTPGGEQDIFVPVPESQSAATFRRPSEEITHVDTADCLEIEDLDDQGWELVNTPAEPLPNDSEVLLSTTESSVQRREPVSADERSSSWEREPEELSGGLRPNMRTEERAASELDLRPHSAATDTDTASLQDEPLMDNDNGPKLIDLEQFSEMSDLESLNVKQLKELLTRNRVEFRGCIERAELLDRAQTLWRNHTRDKDEVDKLPMEECCKICMAAPLECVLLECGHIAACTACSKQLAECPICRQYVVRAVRFFRS